MSYFDDIWLNARAAAAEDGLHPRGETLARWVVFMQERGHKKRLHGDLLNKMIVDTIVDEGIV